MRTILRDLESVSGVRCGYVVRNGEVLASTFAAEKAAALAAGQELIHGVAEGLALVDRDWEEVLVDLGEASLMVLPVEEGFTIALLAGADTNLDLLRVVMQSSVRQIRAMLSLPPPEPTPAPVVAKVAAQPPPAARPEPARPAAAPEQRQSQQSPAAARPGAVPPKPAVPPQRPAEQRPAAQQQRPADQRQAVPPRPAVDQKQAAPQQRPAADPKQAATQKQPPAPPKPAAPPPKPAEAPAPAASAKSSRAAEDAEPLLPKILELLTGSIGPVARVTFKRGVSRWKESNAPTVGNLPSLVEILAADLSSDEERRWFVEEVERLRGS